jgi:hypothetical protein
VLLAHPDIDMVAVYPARSELAEDEVMAAIAEAAIASFISPDADERQERPPLSGLIRSTAIFNVSNAKWALPTKPLPSLCGSG